MLLSMPTLLPSFPPTIQMDIFNLTHPYIGSSTVATKCVNATVTATGTFLDRPVGTNLLLL